MFGSSLEGFILKWTLGIAFAVVFILFGLKIIMLLWTVGSGFFMDNWGWLFR